MAGVSKYRNDETWQAADNKELSASDPRAVNPVSTASSFKGRANDMI